MSWRAGTADDDALSPISPATRAPPGGFTLIELLIVVAMIAVLATIAFPILLRARISSNEGVAVASLRTIHSAQAAYASTCGAGGYAQTLDDLSKKPPASRGGFIQDPYVDQRRHPERLCRQRDGRPTAPPRFSTAGDTCNGSADDAVTGFVAERHPRSVAETGVRVVRHRHRRARCTCVNDGDPIDNALSGTHRLPLSSSAVPAPPQPAPDPQATSGAGPFSRSGPAPPQRFGYSVAIPRLSGHDRSAPATSSGFTERDPCRR